MRILIINGSPKGEKSNSLRLTHAFVEGVKKENQSKQIFTEIEQLDVLNHNSQILHGCLKHKKCFVTI